MCSCEKRPSTVRRGADLSSPVDSHGVAPQPPVVEASRCAGQSLLPPDQGSVVLSGDLSSHHRNNRTRGMTQSNIKKQQWAVASTSPTRKKLLRTGATEGLPNRYMAQGDERVNIYFQRHLHTEASQRLLPPSPLSPPLISPHGLTSTPLFES